MEKILFNNSNSSSSKVKDSWERENNLKFDKDYPYGYPWPPRYYTCNFCHREFRSAQALGGHMNIHRRDRARLRDLSPTIDSDQNPNSSNNSNPNNPNPNNPNPNPNNPNPNPNNPSISNNNNFSSPSSSSPTIINNNNTTTTHQSYSLVSLSLSSIPPTNHGKEPSHYKIENPVFVSSIVDDYNQNNNNNNNNNHHQIRVLKNSANNSTKEVVRLDLELCVGEEAKEDLDLELRLGVK